MPQAGWVEVAEAHPVQAVGVLQQGGQLPGRIGWQRFAGRVKGHRRLNGRVVLVAHAPACKQRPNVRQVGQARPGIGPMTRTSPVVATSDVVQVDGRPETWHLVAESRGLNKTERVHEHPRNMGLAMQQARVPEQLGRRYQFVVWHRDEGSHSLQVHRSLAPDRPHRPHRHQPGRTDLGAGHSLPGRPVLDKLDTIPVQQHALVCRSLVGLVIQDAPAVAGAIDEVDDAVEDGG
jgi:hypothetical protein